MKRDIVVAPSILSADFSQLSRAVELVQASGAHCVHCDVMDGEFVPNITFGMKAIADIKRCTTLPLDVHLMIIKPERYLESFVEAGANTLSFHIEAVINPVEGINTIKSCGARCGLAISPDTAINTIFPYLHLLNSVTVMGVYPGFGGQSYIADTSNKIAKLKEEIDRRNLDVDIIIDGGVTLKNVAEIKQAGANVIVAGNAFFTSSNPTEVVKHIINN